VRVEELWAEAYQGEVLGEVLFGRLARGEPDPDRRSQLELLARMEAATKALAEPVFERNGFDRGDTAVTIATAESVAAEAAELSWEDLLRSIAPVADTFLVRYRELAELVDGEDLEVAEAYVAHELALTAFARRALGDELGDPLEPILALPHVAAGG
jgi:hypothetical protein